VTRQLIDGHPSQEEEHLWTELIDRYEGVGADWGPDIVGRAYGNRGNSRSRQGKMDAALADYNKAIQICPWSVDPVLNRLDLQPVPYTAGLHEGPPIVNFVVSTFNGGHGRWVAALLCPECLFLF
jgi:tetratricopeptide (TPR) repeat protein